MVDTGLHRGACCLLHMHARGLGSEHRALFPLPVLCTRAPPCRAAVTSVSFMCLGNTCAPLYFCVILYHFCTCASPCHGVAASWGVMPLGVQSCKAALATGGGRMERDRQCRPVGPALQFLSSRTLAGGWGQGEAWPAGSWLVLLGPHRTRPQPLDSCHALITCSCPGVLCLISKHLSPDRLGRVCPRGLLEPATGWLWLAPLLLLGVLREQDSALLPPSPLMSQQPFRPMGACLWGSQAERGFLGCKCWRSPGDP